MALSPNQLVALAVEMQRIYGEAETAVLKTIASQIEKGIEEETWADQKSEEFSEVLETIQEIIENLKDEGADNLDENLDKAYKQGAKEAQSEIKSSLGEEAAKKMEQPALSPASVIAKETLGLLENTHFRILRESKDQYRKIIADATGPAVTGAITRRKAAQAALNQFANKGITGFISKDGRHWSIETYAENATRTALARSMIQGHTETLRAHGRDLVIISDSPEECELCRPHEGQVYSLSGDDPKYPPLQKAIDDGLFHNGCTHRQHLYIEGVTKRFKSEANPKGYKERQYQRYLERGIRQWKRRETVAISKKDLEFAEAKRKEWQQRMRDFIDDADRRRRYDREQIGKAR